MKIEYQRFDFAKGTVEDIKREIDSTKVLAGNAFFQMLSRKPKADDQPKKDPA
jgi:hypothetical protein